jgi:hypothetical protein
VEKFDELKSLAKRLVSPGEDENEEDKKKAEEKAEVTVPVQARVGMKVIRASGEVEDLGVIHDEKAFVPREMVDDWKAPDREEK